MEGKGEKAQALNLRGERGSRTDFNGTETEISSAEPLRAIFGIICEDSRRSEGPLRNRG